jgi:Putative beta-lactamase-inhibitor-like, PepSY-like
MKKIIIYLAVFAITAFVSCENEQEISASEVPEPVMNAFQSKYPNITAKKWIKENEKSKSVYEAKFKNNNKDVEAEFDENGNFIEEE